MMCEECAKKNEGESASMTPLRIKIEKLSAGVKSENPDSKIPKNNSKMYSEESDMSGDVLDQLKGFTINTMEDLEYVHKIIMENIA